MTVSEPRRFHKATVLPRVPRPSQGLAISLRERASAFLTIHADSLTCTCQISAGSRSDGWRFGLIAGSLHYQLTSAAVVRDLRDTLPSSSDATWAAHRLSFAETRGAVRPRCAESSVIFPCDRRRFLFALAGLIIGVGLSKGNIASHFGALYKEMTCAARGFQIFYIAINVAVERPSLVTHLGETSLAYGFGTAGIVMVLGV